MSLIDVRANLTLVWTESLSRTLGVEHERVCHQVDRSEVRLESASAKLREVGVCREAENSLNEARQNWLREQLLVLASSWQIEILPGAPSAVELPISTGLRVEQLGEHDQLRRNRDGLHQNCAHSVKSWPRGAQTSDRTATVVAMTPPTDPSALTPPELEALRGAGAWYAKYHASRIAELADDPSAYAEIKRDKYLTLVAALRKLGFEMALPDALRPGEREAA